MYMTMETPEPVNQTCFKCKKLLLTPPDHSWIYD